MPTGKQMLIGVGLGLVAIYVYNNLLPASIAKMLAPPAPAARA